MGTECLPLAGKRAIVAPIEWAGRCPTRWGGVMEPGIFEYVFSRPSLAATLDVVADHGVRWLQFDFVSAGVASLPDQIPAETVTMVGRETEARGIRIAAVSGTYNMIHPDRHVRDQGRDALRAIAAACHEIGTRTITLCTGTRDPNSMWRRHPDNDEPVAWRDLLASLSDVLAIADEYDVTLAFEPEPANVVKNARRGHDLLREVDHPRLQVVMDPANILAGDLGRPPQVVLDEAFALLGDRIAVAHAKDLSAAGEFCAAGTGIVPWDYVVARLREVGFTGPLILHSLDEAAAPRAIDFLRGRITGNASSAGKDA